MSENTIDIKQKKQVPTGYKQTPIGVIPEDWEVKKIKEILLQGRLGGNYENSEGNDGIPVIKMGNLNRGNINIGKIQFLPLDEFYNSDDILREGDLLFNTRNTLDLVGKVAIWKNELPKALYNSNLLRLKFKEEFVASNYFMNYLFNSSRSLSQLRGFATGTTSVAAIYSRDLEQLKLSIPSLPEQQKIAEILSTWDKAIETCKRTIENLQQRNKGLAQQFLNGKTRVKGFEDKWKIMKLENFIIEHKEKPLKSNTYEVFTSSKNGLMFQKDYYGDINRITEREDADYNVLPPSYLTYRSRSDDGLFTFNINNYGITGLISGYYPVFTLKNMSKDFFLYYMNYYKSKLTKYSSGTSQLVLSMKELKTAKFLIPDSEEQKSIVNILNIANEEQKQYEQKLANLQLQKKGLMQQLLTGKVRVKN